MQHINGFRKPIIEWKKPDTKLYIPYDFIYTKFKRRQGKFMLLKVREVATTGAH